MRSARENLKFMEDLARMATGAFGSLSEIRHQVKTMVKERVDQLMEEMNMVSRHEFDRVEAIATKAREKQELLEKRLAVLEKKLKTSKTAKGKKK